jgi:hypothetical protein
MMDRICEANQYGKSYHKIQNRWTLLYNNEDIRTFHKYVKRKKEKAAQGETLFKGSYVDKVQKIRVHMQKFDEARNMGAAVHDWHLQVWALQSAKEVNLKDFKSSKTFVTNLKHEHGILSREITKSVVVKMCKVKDILRNCQ